VQRDVDVFLDDILESCARISRYTAGSNLELFRGDEKTVDAVVRNLEIVGEAAKKVPPATRAMIDVDWRRIASLRDLLIHEYFGVDIDIVWDIVISKIPDLSTKVSSYLNRPA
jgi:uncharacterized protein with HEPN domain